MSRELKDFAEEVARRPGAEERVLARVLAEIPEARSSGALIREIPAMTPGAEGRVLGRLRRSLARPARRWRPLLIPALALAGAAAAAAYIAAPPAPPPRSTLEPLALDGGGALAEIPGLAVQYQGVGELSGTAAAPVIHWARGTLRLELDPARGAELVVITDEGRVRVLGTILTVRRDAMGTRVEVERGRVSLECAGGGIEELAAGASGACLPTTAAGMLGRGHAQLRAGAPVEEVLESVDAGQALAAPGDLDWRELQALRIQALLSDRRRAAACRAALDYPEDPGDPRAAELEAILASRWCTADAEP